MNAEELGRAVTGKPRQPEPGARAVRPLPGPSAFRILTRSDESPERGQRRRGGGHDNAPKELPRLPLMQSPEVERLLRGTPIVRPLPVGHKLLTTSHGPEVAPAATPGGHPSRVTTASPSVPGELEALREAEPPRPTPGPHADHPHFLRRKSRALIVLDLQEGYIPGNERRILELVRKVDMFFPSEDEVRSLTGSEDWEDLARQFARLGPQVIAIKFGVRGSLVYERARDMVTRIPARATKVIDTTGAGDASCGGLLATYGKDPENLIRAARAGAVSAAFAVSDYGPDGLLAANSEQARDALDDSSGWLPSRTSHAGSRPKPECKANASGLPS